MSNAEAMFGSAGSIMSMASGFRAMIEAITRTNSGKPVGRCLDETKASAFMSVTLRTSLEHIIYGPCCGAQPIFRMAGALPAQRLGPDQTDRI